MGLALCASVAVEANPAAILDIHNSETSYNLICHLETSIECAEPLHVHHITKEGLKLLQQGGFIKPVLCSTSFISRIVESMQSDWGFSCNRFPWLGAEVWLHLLYKHDEVEFNETIRQCVAMFSNKHEVSPKLSSSSNEDLQSEPVDPAVWKDKGKSVLEN